MVVGERDLLELVVVVDALEGVEIDGGCGGNDHVEPIRAEVAMPGVFYDLGKDDFFEADGSIDHDGLAHKHD